jgi:hypothetical protein
MNITNYFVTVFKLFLSQSGVEGYYSFDHTQGHNAVGRIPMDDGSAHRRDLYLTTHNTQNRQTSMPLAGFERAISAGDMP